MNSGRERVERRLAAVLVADVAGYSRLMGEDEEGTLAALKAIRRDLVDLNIGEHRGRIVKTTGDGLLVEFASVIDAVRCAVKVQRKMAERNAAVPEPRPIEFRIGINLGDIIIEDEDIYGEGINVAARLEALAEPGGICISQVVYDQVRDKLDIGFEDLGEQRLKNIMRPVHVYRIAVDRRALRNASLPLPDKPSLAVLPFQNMTGDPEQDYFVDGIVEEITTAISRLPWLFVIARNSSFTYKDRAVDVKQVARELGVRYVLEGSVRKAGNRVRITGQLIDTATGAHIWADRFDGTLDDIFELQDEVAHSVVGAIEPKLRHSEIARATRKPTESLDAYDLYLRALAQFHLWIAEGHCAAIRLLLRAIEIDPSYAPAGALVGWCRANQKSHGWATLSDADAAESVDLATRAIQTAKDDSETLAMAGIVILYFVGEHAIAESTIQRALVVNANCAHAYMASGMLHCFLNRPDEAIEALQRFHRLSPLDPLAHYHMGYLAWAHMLAGRYQEAMIWVNQAVREQPRWVFAARIKVALCGHLGLVAEGHAAIKRLTELFPGSTIAGYVNYASTIVLPDALAIYAEGLRKAGLPEE